MARMVLSVGCCTPDLETQMMHMMVSSFVIGCDIHYSAGRESQVVPVFPARLISKLCVLLDELGDDFIEISRVVVTERIAVLDFIAVLVGHLSCAASLDQLAISSSSM